MENKLGYWSPDDAGSFNDNDYEIEKQERKKRKFTQDDGADYLINKSRKKTAQVCKNCNKLKSHNVCAYGKQCNSFDCRSADEKIVCGKRIECDVVEEGFSRTRAMNMETKNSVEEQRRKNRLLGRIKLIDGLLMCLDEPCLIFDKLEVKDMESLREDVKAYLDLDRETVSRRRYWEALLVVCDWELSKARKKEALDRARVRGEISPAEFLDAERGLHLKTEADVKYFLEGDSYSEIEVLQSDIESLMFSGSAAVVEFWEPILKHICIYKAKAFLKEECHATILHMNLRKDHRSIRCQKVDAGYDGKDDQSEIEGAEGTGSSFSPELLYGEETADNFEMKTMGVMEEVDALSANIDEAILRSPVYRPATWPVPHQAMGVFC